MSDARELIKAIITGKDYNEVFASVMANKVGDFLDVQKERIAKEVFVNPVPEEANIER